MLVSIIIPVYNVSSYIERCLNSVFQQTYKSIEIIMIDDCSTDDSMNKINTLINCSAIDSTMSIRIISHYYNMGLSCARNTGLDASNGEYIYFLDSDDYISNTCIELLVDNVIKNSAQMVIGNFEVDGTGYTKSRKLNMTTRTIKSNIEIRNLFFKGSLYMMAWNKLINRSFLETNRLYFFSDILHEDDHWSYFVANKLDSITICSDVTYYYYMRSTSITNNKREKNYVSRMIISSSFLSSLNKYDQIDFDYVFFYAFHSLKDFTMNVDKKINNSVYSCRYRSFQYLLNKLSLKTIYYILPFIIPRFFHKYFFSICCQIEQYRKHNNCNNDKPSC